MRSLKLFSVLAGAVFALSAVASAAPKFRASTAGGGLTGARTTNQVFKINGGTMTCTAAAASGTVAGTGAPPESAAQEVNVTYSGCTFFGFVNTDISTATLLITANGELNIEKTITITPTGAGCTLTVGPQTVKSVSYDIKTSGGFTGIEETSAVSGITYTSSGGFCGSSGTNGTCTGNSFLHGPTGVTLSWDKE